VLLPADLPDLPGLLVAKAFRALRRAEVVVAPEVAGSGIALLGCRLPWPGWMPSDLDLGAVSVAVLRSCAPRVGAVATTPPWHRLRTPGAARRLDLGLEGWEETRALLATVSSPVGPPRH